MPANVIGTTLNKEVNQAMLRIVWACVNIKDQPVCYGTSLLKNRFCVNKRYAFITQNHLREKVARGE